MPKDKNKERDWPVFRPQQSGLRKILGDLETDIMEAIWAEGPDARLTVREVHGKLEPVRAAAYTTILTVMGILAKKGLLAVEKDSFAHRYHATQTREAFTQQAVAEVIDGVMNDFSDAALAHFAHTFNEEDAKRTQFLMELIRRKQNGEG